MKTKGFTKILALMVTIVMAMSVMCVPAMAATAGVDYLTASSWIGDQNSYTRTQFLADFNVAEHTAVLTFEDGTYEIATQANQTKGSAKAEMYGDTINGYNVPISNCTDAELNLYWKGDRPANYAVADLVKDTLGATSGSKSIDVWTQDTNPNKFVFGYQKTDGTSNSLITTSLTGLRPVAVGLMYSRGAKSGNYMNTIRAKYTDGTEEDINDSNSTLLTRVGASDWVSLDKDTDKNTGYFVGIKAPEGKFIQHIQFRASIGYVDDICVILEDPNATAEEEISATLAVETKEIEQPAYHAKASYTLEASAKDGDGNELNLDSSAYTWELVGSYTGVSLKNGTLTVARNFDTNSKIKVKASLSDNASISTEGEIAVTPVEPYYRADRIAGSKTDYTREAFVNDLNNAKHIAVLNMEEGSFADEGWMNNTDGMEVPISNLANANNTEANTKGERYTKVKIDKNGGVFDYIPVAVATSGKNAVATTYNGYTNKISFDNNGAILKLGYAPVAVGFTMGLDSGSREQTTIITYTDGTTTTEPKVTISATEDKKSYFFGYKAPAGKFIKSVEFSYPATTAYLDDICMIFELVPKFASDAEGANAINTLSDISASSDVYVTLPASGVAGSKLILAAYDANGLVDVNIADANPAGGVAQATINVGTASIKAIKAFVWNSETGLTPIDGFAELK